MARTIAEIQQQIIDTKEADTTLNAYAWSNSKVAIWRLWTYVVAVCIWSLENLFDSHKEEVAQLLAAQRPHTLQWYVNKARQFQYGTTLPDGSDTYTTTTEDPLVMIVKYAAAVELPNIIRLKVARQGSASLEGLTGSELAALKAYMGRIKDAGIRLQVTSAAADNLLLSLKIYYDPLVLMSDGSRIDGTAAAPVKTTVNTFLADLPFNGVFILNKLIAALQSVDGVKIGQVLSAQANYAATPYVPITVKYIPDAGYMALDATYFDANISYEAYIPE
jgi:hypothetical protein